MKTTIIKGLDEKQKEEMVADFKAAVHFRKRIVEIAKEKILTIDTATQSKDMYASPSWPYVQADAVGYKRGLNEIISLLTDEMSKNS